MSAGALHTRDTLSSVVDETLRLAGGLHFPGDRFS